MVVYEKGGKVMSFQIKKSKFAKPTVRLNEQTAEQLGLVRGSKVEISYGKRNMNVILDTKSSVAIDDILIDEKVISEMLVETGVRYELKFFGNRLIIGPIIGLLLGRKGAKLENNLNNFLLYTQLYSYIGGVLFVFAEDQIDFQNGHITGYIYDPKLGDHPWREAKLPFPGAIFRRVELSKTVFQNLVKTMGNRFFNGYYFNKWELWEWVSPDLNLQPYLPETSQNINKELLEYYLNLYEGVYFKPRGGSRGKGIYYIEKEKGLFKVQKNYEADPEYMDEIKIEAFLSSYPSYLLQQPINLKTYDGRKIDYRAITQKDLYGDWQCTGIIGRFGKRNAITSNFLAKGFARDAFEAIQLQFECRPEKAFKLYEEMTKICIEIATAIDRIGGGYGDLGIDLGIDNNEKIWLIEINKRPDHDLPLKIKDRKMYYDIKSNPILYANYLAMS